MGNQVDDIAQRAGIQIQLPAHSQIISETGSGEHWDVRLLARLARAPFFKGLFLRLYNRLFQIYSQSPR
jgi:hypothetical protein